MKGTDILSQLRDNAKKLPAEPTAQVTLKDDPPPEPDDGSTPDLCGLQNTKYAQQGFVLVDSSGTPLGLSYAAITSTIKWLEPCALEFFFQDMFEENDEVKEGIFRVTIIGAEGEKAKTEMRKLQMRIIQQKRELLHPGETGNVIKSIEVKKMDQKEEES